MKLADSLNPATQAENIKKLNSGLEAVDAKTLPDTSAATTGQILKLTGETKTPSWSDEYTPPAYSTTETATGQKWIDGKDIYCKSYDGNTPTTESGYQVIMTIPANSNLIKIEASFLTSGGFSYDRLTGTDPRLYVSNGSVYLSPASNVDNQGLNCKISIFYTKPDPVPETREDDTTPEEKKTTKKKNTK